MRELNAFGDCEARHAAGHAQRLLEPAAQAGDAADHLPIRNDDLDALNSGNCAWHCEDRGAPHSRACAAMFAAAPSQGQPGRSPRGAAPSSMAG